MATISELMNGKTPGEIVIKHPSYFIFKFTPHYCHDDKWFGLATDTHGNTYSTSYYKGSVDWEIYQEPVLLVKKHLYAYSYKEEEDIIRSSFLYYSEAEAALKFGTILYSFYKKLEYTEIEVEA